MRGFAASQRSLCDHGPWLVTPPAGKEGGVIARRNGDDDHGSDRAEGDDPGAAAGAGAGKGDRGVGTYRQEGVSPGVVALGVVALLLLIFIVQNDAKGPISFLFWHFRVRIWGALLTAAALGFAGGYLVCSVRRRRRLARRS
jgi:uncharacterized integral membrane protein